MALRRKPLRESTASASSERVEIKKTVGLVGGVALIAGGIIGSGIFFTPYSILKFSGGSVPMALAVWTTAGFLCLAGGLCYCELGCSMPESGGDYVYLHRAYGPLPAFLFIWSAVLVARPCAQAIVTLPFAKCLMQQFYGEEGPSDAAVTAPALITTFALGFINSVDVKAAMRVQSFLLFVKVTSLLLIALVGFYWLASGETGSLFENSHDSQSSTSVGQVGLAFYSALWAYDGWANLNYALGEVPNPEKTLPRAIVLGLFVVIGCYITVNISFFVLLTKDEFMSSDSTILLIGTKLIGSSASFVVPTLMGMFCLGTANGMCLLGSRLIYAAGKRGQFPTFLGLLHCRFATPVPAVGFHTILCCVYILLGSYESLLQYTSVLAWLVFGLGFLSVYVLRSKEPELLRPYKVWSGLPALMILASLFLVFVPIITKPSNLLVILMFIPGILVYCFVIKGKINLQKVDTFLVTLVKRLGNFN